MRPISNKDLAEDSRRLKNNNKIKKKKPPGLCAAIIIPVVCLPVDKRVIFQRLVCLMVLNTKLGHKMFDFFLPTKVMRTRQRCVWGVKSLFPDNGGRVVAGLPVRSLLILAIMKVLYNIVRRGIGAASIRCFQVGLRCKCAVNLV